MFTYVCLYCTFKAALIIVLMINDIQFNDFQ